MINIYDSDYVLCKLAPHSNHIVQMNYEVPGYVV